MKSFLDKYNQILLQVEKPARYTGGEYNTPDMLKQHELDFCICFPDNYEIGMSNLGISILYQIINARPDMVCERCFAPGLDLAELLKENEIPLLSDRKSTRLNSSH